MKQYGFAVNQIKLQRAIALAKGDESLVYDLYVKMGGKVEKSYAEERESTESMIALTEANDKEIGYDPENASDDVGSVSTEPEEMTIEGEGTIDEEGNVESTITKVEILSHGLNEVQPKRRGRPSKNAK